MAFSPDGRRLAVVTDTVSVWDVATNRLVRRFADRDWQPDDPAFSADGRMLLWTEETQTENQKRQMRTRLVEVLTGSEVASFEVWSPAAFAPDGRTVAVADLGGRIRLYDVATRTEVLSLPGNGRSATALAFSRDGKLLVCGSENGTLLSWDVAKATRRGRPAKAPAADEVKKLDTALAGISARIAYRAIEALAADEATVLALVKGRLKPAATVDQKRLAKLLTQLDADDFDEREEAMRALEKAGEAAVPLLTKLLRQKPPLEARWRAEKLLKAWDNRVPPAEERWAARAVLLLERLGTAAARRELRRLAKGAPTAPLTRDAAAALHRLEH
jgi:hypothetical protein